MACKGLKSLDLKNGFFSVTLSKESCKYTAFVVPDEHYEFLRVSFGLCNSPSVFQRYINTIFRDLIASKTILVYMDDIIIQSVFDFTEKLKDLKTVLDVASQYDLQIN